MGLPWGGLSNTGSKLGSGNTLELPARAVWCLLPPPKLKIPLLLFGSFQTICRCCCYHIDVVWPLQRRGDPRPRREFL